MKRWNGTRLQVVVEIDEEDYKRGIAMADAIRNGIVLPKGHGRLIDADALLEKTRNYGEGQQKLMLIDPFYVKNAEPIVEADRESEDNG